MKFCGSCGKEMSETARFCPSCGASAAPASDAAGAARQDENAAQPDFGAAPSKNAGPAKPDAGVKPFTGAARAAGNAKPAEAKPVPGGAKKKAPRKVFAIVAVIVVLAIALYIGAGAALNSPKALIGTSISNTLKSLRKSDEGAVGLLKNVANGGSIEISADLSEWDILRGSLPLSGRMKFYSDAADKKFAAEMSLTYDGERPVDAALYASPDAIVLGSNSLLKNKYGVNLKKAASNLDKSVFAPDSGTDFALDEDIYAMLRAFFESFGEKNKDLEKNLTDLSNKYIELLIDVACKAGETEKESVTLEIGSEKVKTTAVTLTLDTEAMAEIVREMAKEAAKDKKLRSTAKDLAALGSGTAMFGYYGAPDQDELEEEIDEFFDNLVDEAEEIAEEIESMGNFRLILEFYVAKDGKTLAAFSMKAREGSDIAFSLSLTLGKNLGTSEEISLRMNHGWYNVAVIYSVAENTKTDYAAKLTFQEGNSSQSIRITWSKSDGTYRVSGGGVDLRGTLKQSGKKTTITVREVTINGRSMDIDLTVVLNESESVPSPGSYTDILTITETQIENLVEDVADRLLDTALYGLMKKVF
ncbi:MAG: zinc ribbon domain-containing protein [Clostridiales bacterium]|nr:zinc ribbon domain-containing protein [Clostridiales bacterium]